MDRLIAVIPARGGSKRLPGKNIRPLGGRPLIAWTIDVARASGCFERVVVSTDDLLIAEVARNAGADVPWLRPVELATDTAVVADAVVELLQRLKSEGQVEPTGVALLQPTSPFRSIQTIRRGCDLYRQYACESVVSVSPVSEHPYWMRKVDADLILKPFIDLKPEQAIARSQDLPPVYIVNGLFYLAHPRTLFDTGTFYSKNTHALVIEDPLEAIDIDTIIDWKLAEAVLAEVRNK